MNTDREESGDGLLLHNAVKLSKRKAEAIYTAMGIGSATLYRLFKEHEIDDDVKQSAAKALGKSVEEIFGSSTDTGIKASSNKEVIALGKHVPLRLTADQYAEAYGDWLGIPMYNAPITASFVNSYRDSKVIKPQYYLHDPRFKDCDFGAIITGDSMHGEIRHGDYVALKEIFDKEFLVYGDIYYVVTPELETCKYINADPKNDDNVMLVPHNTKISPTPVPRRMLQRVFKVRGVVRGY